MQTSVRIRVDELIEYYAGLVRALGAGGIGGSQLNALLESCQWAECAQCAIAITGNEMNQILVAESAATQLHPKLRRLKLGYCAREGCESYHYSVHFKDSPGVNWSAVAEAATKHVAESKVAAQQKERRKLNRKRNRRMQYAAAVLAAILIILLLRSLVQSGHLSSVQKRQKYQVDPASVAARPRS